MATSADTSDKFWVAFSRVPYIGPTRIDRLNTHFGDLGTAWKATDSQLRAVLDERSRESLLRFRATFSPDDELGRLNRSGITVVTLRSDSYPRLLREIPMPPPVIYVKGEVTPADETAVAIVGTRRMTSYGREVARSIAAGLAAAGVTIVSGLARGIDGISHDAALRAGGRTVAVLGSGVNVIYPPEHRKLAEEIAQNGAVISVFPPEEGPNAPNFPARNRIISGMSLAVVVIEAPERSGTLITVDFAADQGRDVFVVPGSVLSAASVGSIRLLRDGARPVASAADILEDLNLGRRRQIQAIQQELPLDEDERRLLAVLTGEPQHIDDVAAAANLTIAKAGSLLMTMELKGSVRNAGAQHYARG